MAYTTEQPNDQSRRTFVKNSIWITVLPAIASVLGPSGPVLARTRSHDTIRQRKNIEDIDPTDYIHALDKLRERAADPNADDNFFYYAWIHNTDNPPCEHNGHLFLPWHRALLYFFEQALQKVDPPRTDNVTLPYYDYTALPKDPGQRYPSVFEDSASVLGQEFFFPNNWRPSTRLTAPIDEPFYSYSEDVAQLIENNPNWSSSNVESGGSSGGFGGRPNRTGKGAVETPQHDWMHFGWMAGLLGRPSTAAFDPIFWSFHAFEDLIFELWIKRWGVSDIDGQDIELQNMPEACHVKDVLDTKDLGYIYDFTPPPGLESLVTSLGTLGSFAQRKPQIARQAGEEETRVLQTYDLKIPVPGFKVTPLIIRDFEISETTSYHGYIYLYPKSVEFDPKSELFRERYLVDYFAVFSMQMSGMKTDLSFDLTAEFVRLSELYPDKEWVITVAVATGEDAGLEAVAPDAPTIGPVELQIIK